MAHADTDVGRVGPAIAGTRRRLISIEMPRKWWQWMIVSLLAVVILFVGLLLTGMHTGRIGFVPVKGNSMQSVFPWGTAVFVIPVEPRDGNYVVAWGRLDGPGTDDDQESTLLVKKLTGGRLTSTDSDDHAQDFEIRGVVVGQLPIQKVFWWMDKGAINPAPNELQPSSESMSLEKSQREMFERTHEQIPSLEAYREKKLVVKSNNASVNAEVGVLLDNNSNTSIDVLLKDKNLEVSIDFRKLGSGVTCEVIPSGGSIPFEEHKDAGKLDLCAKAMEGPPFFLAGIAEIRLWRRR